MKPAEEPVVTTTRAGSSSSRRFRVMPRDPRAQRRDTERLGVADAADRQRGAAAAIAVAGAGAAGCPTSIWMTSPPAASMRAAAAITSITMKGGTSLRAEAAGRLPHRASRFSPDPRPPTPPRCCRIRRLSCRLPRSHRSSAIDNHRRVDRSGRTSLGSRIDPEILGSRTRTRCIEPAAAPYHGRQRRERRAARLIALR